MGLDAGAEDTAETVAVTAPNPTCCALKRKSKTQTKSPTESATSFITATVATLPAEASASAKSQESCEQATVAAGDGSKVATP